MKMKKSWILFSFFNFLVAAVMGLILRGAFVWEINWMDYRNLMHGHSHVAMLGWVYLALYILIGYRFIPKDKWEKPIYSRLFWFTQMTVIGMMISFPVQGYGAVSITFSALHILASYTFCYLVWRDHQAKGPELALLLKTALVLMVISTIGVWSLGPLTLSGGRSSTLYQLAIQFYLHFQFHGWFTLSALALVLDTLVTTTKFSGANFKRFYNCLLLSVVLTYGLVLSWGYGGSIPLIVNGVGLIFQVLALLLFLRLIRESDLLLFHNASPSTKAFYRFGFVSWVLKVVLQTIVLIPAVAVISFTLRPLMIGFIHLTMLGFISGLLFALLFGAGSRLPENKTAITGRVAFITGFVSTELLLFAQGLSYWLQWGQIPAYYELMFYTSLMLPVSILIIISLVNKHLSFKNTHQREPIKIN